MTTPPLKRHPALQPFSRDHHTGLVQAGRLMRAAKREKPDRCRVAQEFARAWETELGEHFADEEALLLPLMTNTQQDRLREEHNRLRRFADALRRLAPNKDPGAEWAHEAGQLLNDHIRWEERELFPAIEQACTTEQLTALERRTAEFEARRSRTMCTRARRDEKHGSPESEE